MRMVHYAKLTKENITLNTKNHKHTACFFVIQEPVEPALSQQTYHKRGTRIYSEKLAFACEKLNEPGFQQLPTFHELAISTLCARKPYLDQMRFLMRQLHELLHVFQFE
ncbi:hypothetical protein [Vibrio parahaemolyticus]|uniref:hypothetical protein n=1 Tax=Vibrio parahaemolyticus TaxID=670 RepID=UPI0004123F11|nr:hypothetical protein [Vibrio parahaemolyticus]HCH0379539.1 hypothetical protein [Vibrio parahaemolyticus]